MQTLNQVITKEKTVKGNVNSELTALSKQSENPSAFTGFTKKYRPRTEDGEIFPSDNKKVQRNTENIIKEASISLTKLFDITAIKDFNNCGAKADIVIGNEVLVVDCPPPYLIFLEKQLHEYNGIIRDLTELEPEYDWNYNKKTEQYETDVVTTHKTKKVQKPLVLVAPTKEHPGQAQVLTVDETIGNWDTIKLSGAITVSRKKQLLANIQELVIAVRCAKERANMHKVEDVKVGEKLFNFLLKV